MNSHQFFAHPEKGLQTSQSNQPCLLHDVSGSRNVPDFIIMNVFYARVKLYQSLATALNNDTLIPQGSIIPNGLGSMAP